MKQEKYLVFVVFVYEQKDQLGNFQNSTKLELIAKTRDEAEKRAVEIAGDDLRKHVHTSNVFEKFADAIT